MPYLFVCEPKERVCALHALAPSAPLPGMQSLHVPATAFFRAADTGVAWTHHEALAALDALRVRFGAPFAVDYAFRSVSAGAPSTATAHFAGLAFDIGRTLPLKERVRLYHAAAGSGLFAYVAPPYVCGASVHVSVCGALPSIGHGDVHGFVFVLQSVLSSARLASVARTGTFCAETERGVKRLQLCAGLPVTGRMDARSWHALFRLTR